MNNLYLAALAMVPGIGSVRLRALISTFGDAEAVWRAGRTDLRSAGCLGDTLCNNVIKTREQISIDKLADRCEKAGVRIIGLYDEDYPTLLAAIYNPPAVLYYRGSLPTTDKLIAVVGARRATAYGRNVCNMIAAELAAAGVGVVSGAARGIDASAHLGALEAGYTIAVLANGTDISYPPENSKLLQRITEHGAVLSEYPPGTPPTPGQFPARNRIINGLAKGVLVVEAAERSGALITADFALEEGRDVFAVPGSILSSVSRGTHKLIKQGAKLVESGADILEEYGWLGSEKQAEKVQLGLEETAVLRELSFDKVTALDDILERTGMTIPHLTYILLQLELQGLAEDQGGQRYLRIAREGTR